ncbi:methyltransferase-like protein 13 [Histomonas meleagridis]|uniref:methyltransferase-like protein 13 n=1 Tax=Histomonas meleagridis TaxID=135588 RepID=UPI00355A5808|nr:methyltransferase-like protein 13 [Histomonas meleagridis]KAH0806718.1 methyltransferase-like protein 13 [Histomonas meleagridis]
MSEQIPDFGNMTYWDDGYKTGEAPAEWFVPYSTIRKFIHKHLGTDKKTLVIGCGTSDLSFEMYNEGYKDIQSMDYSPEAIEEMKVKYPQLEWSVMDVREMTYPNESFDSIVDKGTLDCLFFLDETNEQITKMLLEVSRVLKSGGQYVVVTCGHPMQRNEIFMKPEFNWTVIDWKEYEPPDGSFTHPSAFIYCMKKK